MPLYAQTNWSYFRRTPARFSKVLTVTITHRLISKLGAAWANQTGITVMVYKNTPVSLLAPDKFLENITTDASGNLVGVSVSDIGLSGGQSLWAFGMQESTKRSFIRWILPTYT